MGQFFGTDGIRGRANRHPMTPEFALKIGRAAAALLAQNGKGIVIGQDTRISGDMLRSALAAGICSAGVDVLVAGVLPTPGVAYMTAFKHACAGIVISASHNPYEDNGIKIFDAKGYKISAEIETNIEALVQDDGLVKDAEKIKKTGHMPPIVDAVEQYRTFLLQSVPREISLSGLKIVLDCSNGATYQIAPELFAGLGAGVKALSIDPDGLNINAGCGSEHPEALVKTVVESDADLGLAFDGDGDRLIAVDERGQVLSGDQLMAIFARDLKKRKVLANDTVVTTVMSNMGFKAAMQQMGIRHLAAAVGDRNVMEMMLAEGAILGGENSGHMIFLNHHTTGDGMLSALQLARIMAAGRTSLSSLAKVMTVFPQVIVNVAVKEKPDIDSIPAAREAIASAESDLGGQGRVLVRYSGTQDLCRVMVEGPDSETTHRYCNQIAETIKKVLG